MSYENTECPLRKMEIYLMKDSAHNLPCSRCKTGDAQFQTSRWYDDQSPDKDTPIIEMLCRICLSTELMQEWA